MHKFSAATMAVFVFIYYLKYFFFFCLTLPPLREWDRRKTRRG